MYGLELHASVYQQINRFCIGFLTLFCINVFSYSTVNWRKALRPAAWLIGSIVTILLVIAMIQPFRMHTKFERGYIPVAMSETFKSRIAKDVTGMDVEQILDYSHDLTKSLLTYSWTRQPFNEHRVTSTDCFGYAQVFATISNYALKTNKFPAKVKAVCGQVHFLGINVHPIVESLVPSHMKRFVKDHDYNEYTIDGNKYVYDTSLDIHYVTD